MRPAVSGALARRMLVAAFIAGAVLGAGYLLLSRGDACYRDRTAPENVLPESPAGADGTNAGSGRPTSPVGPSLAELEPLKRSESWRFGIGVPGGLKQAGWVPRLGAGWWISWGVLPPDSAGRDVEFWQMVRLRRGRPVPPVEDVVRLARQSPGQVWIIGNEPDVKWQDNVTPACYASLYHELYTRLKQADPSAVVAVAGVAQGTSLRLAYLDQVIESYEERYGSRLPVDLWTLHGFVLREQRGWWGVEIPPGIANDVGQLYGVQDHDDARAFRAQIVAFRRWMADRGYRDLPLAVTEYGILMPGQFGFTEDRVARFMVAAFDYFRSASDPDIGYPLDGNRLVQRWAWFSLADPTYPTGNLIDPTTGRATELGLRYRQYVAELP